MGERQWMEGIGLRPAGWLGLLLVASFALYSPSLRNGFTYDDHSIAKAEYGPGVPNPLIRDPQPLGEYFRSHYWKGAKSSSVEYRPLSILSYALTYRTFGVVSERTAAGEAFPQHLFNLLLYVLAVWLSFALLRAASVREPYALVGTLFFALNAIHSEVVASVIGRAEILAFVFGGGGVLLGLRGALRSGVERVVLYGLASLCFGAGLLSKENAIAWPAFLSAMLWVRQAALRGESQQSLESSSWKRLVPCLTPALATAATPIAVFLVLRAAALSGLPEAAAPQVIVVANPLEDLAIWERLFSAIKIYGYGLYLTLFPFTLSCDYGLAVFTLVNSPLDLGFLTALTALLGMLLGGLASARRHPTLFLGMASFLGFSFITSNVPLVIGTIFGERLYFAPSLGLAFLAAWLAKEIPNQMRTLALVVGVAWLAASAFLAVERSLLWYDDDTLFLHDVESQPRSVRLQFAASDYWIRRGDPEKQFFHIERAIELHPEPASKWLTLAWFFQRTHAVDGAMEAINRGIHSAPANSIYRFPLHFTRAEFLAARNEDDERDRQIALQQARRLLDSPAEREALARALAGHAEIQRFWSEAARAFADEGDAVAARKASRAFDPSGTAPAL